MQIGALAYSALVDSDSMHTYMGEKTLSSMQINKQNLIPSVARLADSSRATIRGKVPLDIQIGSIIRSSEAHLMPCLAYDCILGMDFLKNFQFVMSFYTTSWTLPSGESGEFVKSATAPASCAAIAEVSDEQRQIVKDLVTRVLPLPSNRPGLTNLAEHKIDVQGHPPVK